MRTAVQEPLVASPRPQLWRITDHGTFEDLRRRGRRARRGPLTLTWLAPDAQMAPVPVRAGFTVGKSAGGAVLRNRVRRRLRAALRQLLIEGRLSAGTYLIGAGGEVARMPWVKLVDELHTLATEVQR